MAPRTPFTAFAQTCDALQREPARLRKMAIVAQFLAQVSPQERPWAARFLIGHPLPEVESRQLQVGPSQLFGMAGTGQGQSTLRDDPVTLAELGEQFLRVSEIQGNGSVRRREQILAGLYHRIPEPEREWLVRILAGEMRHGVSEGVVLEAAARAAGCDADLVRRAHMLRGDTGEVVAKTFDEGCEALRRVSLRLFHPMRVMMADTALEPGQALQMHAGRTAFEYKFDGARVVIHKKGEDVRAYSRRLNEVTLSVPEVCEAVRELPADEAVLEGEAIGVDSDGQRLPFQELMRRFRRVHDLETVRKQVAIRLYLFDLLHLEGRTFLDEPYETRWESLSKLAPAHLLAPRIVTDSVDEATQFYGNALRDGHEGVVAKSLDSPYVPGRRGSHWLKVKHVQTLDLVVIGAEWGTGRRQGWLSNYHLAVRVPTEDEPLVVKPTQTLRAPMAQAEHFAMVGKTFKGPTDEEFETMTRRLLQAARKREPWGVQLSPRFVVEVEYNDLQVSHHYPSGYGLRFARIRRFREDKSPKDADTLGTLHRLARMQHGRAHDGPSAIAEPEPA